MQIHTLSTLSVSTCSLLHFTLSTFFFSLSTPNIPIPLTLSSLSFYLLFRGRLFLSTLFFLRYSIFYYIISTIHYMCIIIYLLTFLETMLGFGGNNSFSEFCSMDHHHHPMNIMNINMDTTNRKFHSFPLTTNNSSLQQHHHNYNNTANVVVRDKIMAHPLFPRLLSSYLNCLKVIIINSILFINFMYMIMHLV